MKIKVTGASYQEVLKKAKEKGTHKNPVKQPKVLRMLMKTLSAAELKAVNFTCEQKGMEKLGKNEPALFLMNHSSFTDLQIAATLLADRQYHIVMTNDGLIGKAGLMYRIGCIPTKKFITDTTLVRDMKYAFDTLHSSILMYPEASYSFDGTQTPLPTSIGKCIKLFNVPVVMIRTKGAFLRDPLYNNLQKRQVSVSATETLLLTKEDIKNTSAAEITHILQEAFDYNHFEEQIASKIKVTEIFRADGLERVLYKCRCCKSETHMKGEGIHIRCGNCGDSYELAEDGSLRHLTPSTSEAPLTIPAWYAWERECVREEIEKDTYRLDLPVDILMLVDTKSMYRVGTGRLLHDRSGFHLTGCDGALDYVQSPKSSYSLYADYFWYEIGDMICIGDGNAQYYCFPDVEEHFPVAKARLAAEEMYQMLMNNTPNVP